MKATICDLGIMMQISFTPETVEECTQIVRMARATKREPVYVDALFTEDGKAEGFIELTMRKDIGAWLNGR